MTTVNSKRNFFYKKLLIDTTAFPSAAQMVFGFQATRVIVCNDGAGSNEDSHLAFSFLQPNLDGELFCADGPITFDGLAEGRLWLKTSANPIQVRVWAWRL